LVSYVSTHNNVTCTAPSGGSVNTVNALTSVQWYNSGTNRFSMCAYSAKGSGNPGAITENGFSNTTTNATIQVIQITGDNSASFSLQQSNSGGSSTSPVWLLSATPTSSAEFLFGALSNGGTEPSWNAIAGFFSVGTLATGSGATGYVPTVYVGAPGAASITGAVSATAFWGTIGIEVLP
jgi:hypothetical protein